MTKSKKKVKKRAVAPKKYNIDLSYNKEHYAKVNKQAARMHYWMVLILLMIIKFLLFAVLVPYILIIQSSILIMILGIIGLIFGIIFHFMINDIEHLEKKHHRIAAILIPSVAIVNIYILVSIQRFVAGYFPHSNEIFLYGSASYLVMFLLPYISDSLRRKK